MKPTYEELQEQLENAKREFRSADITMQNLEAQLKQSKIDADCYKKGMEASNARLVQLAAENAGLKAFGDKLNEMYDGLNGEGEGWQGRAEVVCQQEALGAAMEEFDAIKTPATDAFLAEVRAQVVDLAIEQLHKKLVGTGRSGMPAMVLENFAAKLRKGVQS